MHPLSQCARVRSDRTPTPNNQQETTVHWPIPLEGLDNQSSDRTLRHSDPICSRPARKPFSVRRFEMCQLELIILTTLRHLRRPAARQGTSAGFMRRRFVYTQRLQRNHKVLVRGRCIGSPQVMHKNEENLFYMQN